MDGTTITVAVISASGAIVVGVLKLLKPKHKDGAAPSLGDVSDSLVAIGTNISQSYTPTVHNHFAPARDESFSAKVESKPTIADIMSDLRKERKPYEANQIHKHYVGLRGCWPVTVSGVWEGDALTGGKWTIALTSATCPSARVYVHVDISKYPQLKVVEGGHRAWVDGLIRAVQSSHVYLEDGAQITLE